MTKRRRDQIRRAAARGARWLDKTVPGWSRKIKRRKLDLGSTRYCVLGQIHGGETAQDFADEAELLGLSDERTDWLGFALPGDDDEEWDALTEAWREELKVRPR